MLIFVSNDDGVQSRGLQVLIEIASEFGEVVCVAPDSPRSGAGCQLTVNEPIKLTPIKHENKLHIYSCTGTPVDCIKLGKQELKPRIPDLVLSGVNHGDNSGVNVHYSGTMGIAIEGAICGIPSIGFSLDDHSQEADFQYISATMREVIGKVITKGLPKGVCLNVNFPANTPIRGTKMCRQGRGVWTKEYERIQSPSGEGIDYWLTGNLDKSDLEDETTDFHAVANGYAAITPITIDMTCYALLSDQW